MSILASERKQGISLGVQVPFSLAGLRIQPALRQVAWNGRSRTLEPRVMQVLVALGREPGRIVTRDTLVDLCWGGRIVGDNAIQRVISLLRQLAVESSAFEIETITKVGYRLVPNEAALELPSPVPLKAAGASRRMVLVGGTMLALGGASAMLWPQLRSPDERRAQRLHAAGIETQKRGGSENRRQAIRYLEQAVAADPRLAAAWGDLAYARSDLLKSMPEQEQDRHADAVRDAADKALRLEPDQRTARVTLALLRPPFRNWLTVEEAVLQALRKLPNEAPLLERLGQVRAGTGQWTKAVVDFAAAAEAEPLVPNHQLSLAVALAQIGEIGAANQMLVRAQQLWPTVPWVWLARYNFFLLNDRPDDAYRMTKSPAVGLGGTSPLPPEVAVSVARAAASGGAYHAAAAAAIADALAAKAMGSFLAILYLAILGQTDRSWAVAHDYFLGLRDRVSGERTPLPAMAWRRTDILFVRATAPMRADPRFAKLTASIGLDEYWRVSKTKAERV